MNALQLQYLKEMGVTVWLERHTKQTIMSTQNLLNSIADSRPVLTGSTSELISLRQQISACQCCDLHKTRTQTVFGAGNSDADWFIIGEAPGADEDRQGEPFVGRAGKLLSAMLLAIGLQREQVFIANILKCRPPNNRDPKPEEVLACKSYLGKQIELIKPKIILAVGRIAAQNLLQVNTPIGKMRGNHYRYPEGDIPVIVTYHPAYLLRSPREKSKVWNDLKLAMQLFKQLS